MRLSRTFLALAATLAGPLSAGNVTVDANLTLSTTGSLVDNGGRVNNYAVGNGAILTIDLRNSLGAPIDATFNGRLLDGSFSAGALVPGLDTTGTILKTGGGTLQYNGFADMVYLRNASFDLALNSPLPSDLRPLQANPDANPLINQINEGAGQAFSGILVVREGQLQVSGHVNQWADYGAFNAALNAAAGGVATMHGARATVVENGAKVSFRNTTRNLVGASVPLSETTRVAEFNDLAAVEEQLRHGDVAAILTEPALTNIGIVLPEPGFMEGLRELATRYGALLMIDETHTFSAGPGGATAAWGLRPDIFVIGKSIGGGIPSGAYGISEEVARAVNAHPEADLVDVGGVGGTLAGNALSVAAMRATLEHVLTEDAFARMVDLATEFTAGVQATLDRTGVPWSVARLGARAEYRFASPAPRTGTESAASADEELDEYLHLYLANRGVLITPFHNMALMCPETTADDVALHTRLFGEAVDELVGR